MFYIIGLILLGLLALQLLLGLAGQYRRMRASTQQSHLEKDLIQQQVDQIIAKATQESEVTEAWSGWRKFRVERIVEENATIKSFYLEPHDGKALPAFEPGQHVTFRLKIPGQSKPVIRCYTLSDTSAEKGHYRVTIRRQPAPDGSEDVPNGVSSCYFHDDISQNDVLDVKAPSGKFFLDVTEKTPVVLLSGGVGLTPSLSMLNTLYATKSDRDVWLFYGMRSEEDLIMADHFIRMYRQMPNLRIKFFFSEIDDKRVSKLRCKGHVTVEKIQELGAPLDSDFYICGPPPMMDALVNGLESADVDPSRIHFESFGPASVRTKSGKNTGSSDEPGETFSLTYNVSEKSGKWDASIGTILDAAEADGIDMDSGCRAGSCGTCLTTLVSGDVDYILDPDAEVEAGCCLPCIAVPKSDIELKV